MTFQKSRRTAIGISETEKHYTQTPKKKCVRPVHTKSGRSRNENNRNRRRWINSRNREHQRPSGKHMIYLFQIFSSTPRKKAKLRNSIEIDHEEGNINLEIKNEPTNNKIGRKYRTNYGTKIR